MGRGIATASQTTPMVSPEEVPIEGVRPLEHTADVGLEVEADTPAELFRRAALGMTYLILEETPASAEGGEIRTLRLRAEEMPDLLREWLREILHLHESEGFAVCSVELGISDGWELRAELTGVIDPSEPVREIKGVTLHGLEAAPRSEDGAMGPQWYGRVIFDV